MEEALDYDDNSQEKVVFKAKKKRNLRQRKADSDDDDEGNNESTADTKAKIEEMKEVQKLRQRPHGVNIVGLALGKKITTEEELTLKDPFKMDVGGLVNMQNVGMAKKVDDAYDTGIGTQFSAETNKRDEDEDMMKYIEGELRRRKGVESEDALNDSKNAKKYLTPEETALLQLPSHLRSSSGQKNEEMLSNQMLNGIPEVDLGIEAKIRNIEATEEAKQRVIQEQKKKKDGPSQFVPVNYAANFSHHDRFEKGRKRKTQEETAQPPKEHKNATDDYYFDKFRNKFRKH